MIRIAAIATLLLMSACNGGAKPEQPASNDVTEETKPAGQVASLAGEWQLTEVDGRPIDGGSTEIAFGDGKARLTAGCNRRAWTFTQDRNIVAFTADAGASANCEAAPSAKQEAAFHAVDRATIAIFAKDGAEASLSGNGGNVTLVRR